jgi:aminopeptidase YwaD
MSQNDYAEIARNYLQTLCSVQPNRRTGSPGNREATDFFAHTLRPFGYEVDAAPFDCLDYLCHGASLTRQGQAFDVHVNPYSLGCDVTAELAAVSTVEELESIECKGKLLLMRGAICAEQLMPKNFVFYNPDHHQQIIALLERKQPAGIISATERKPDQVGALYPFPLIVDGDFDIPGVHCRDTVGDMLSAQQGQEFHLAIDARRIPSQASNVIGRLNPAAERKIVFTAHIDAYEDTPGASDNASGTVVLLLVAELLADYGGQYGVEIAAFNGEDHYSAGGQMDYLRRYGDQLQHVALVANVDDVGYVKGGSAYSFYECPPRLETHIEDIFDRFDGLLRGEPWYNGDHMIFVQQGVHSVAFTAEHMPELMRTVTHTANDTPDLIDSAKLVELARALSTLARSF